MSARATRRIALALLLASLAARAAAADLTVAKSSAPVNDNVNTLTPPRNLPGSTIDYALTVGNPLGNALIAVKKVVIADVIPTTVKFRVASYTGSGGPVEFTDGNLLTIPLGSSGLGYTYTSLSSTTDGVEFSDGTSWAYTPQDDGTGYDANVRGIRVTLTGTQMTTGGSFRLRYRVLLK